MENYTPLSQLTDVYNGAWKVYVRLDNTFPITNKKNDRGEFKFCTFEFVDSEGTRMPAQAYNHLCTKYFSELQVGSIYCFSGCRIEKVRSTRSPGLSQSRFLFIFGDEMWIEEKTDEADILSFPMFDFFTIKEILDLKPEELVDIVALIKSAGDLIDDQKTRSGNVLPMREIVLYDDTTGDTTNLTLWGLPAKEFDPELHKAVVVFKGKVKVFQGKRLVDCTELLLLRDNISGFMSLYTPCDASYEAMDGNALLAECDKVLDDSSPLTEGKPNQEE